MYEKERDFKKMCSFYVSDVHLITMLLPYIAAKMEERKAVYTLLEDNLKPIVKKLLAKTNLNETLKKEIMNIHWEQKIRYKYKDFEVEMKEIKAEEINFILMGKEQYRQIYHSNIQKYFEKQTVKVNIIDCYEVLEFNQNIQEILDSHDKILNTSGEKEITEVFENYQKKKIVE